MRILVVANKYWESDPRLQREVYALAENGHEVDLIFPKKPNGNEPDFGPAKSTITPHSISLDRRRGRDARYVFEYGLYFVYCLVIVSWLSIRLRPNMIQVFVMPELLMISCIIPRLLRIPVLMDWMDPMREVFLSEQGRGKSHWIFAIMIAIFEKCAVTLACHIITPNEGFRRAFVKRGVRREKISIVMNSADHTLFSCERYRDREECKNKNTLLYSGTIVGRAGLDIAIRALRLVVDQEPSARMMIAGSGKKECIDVCMDLIRKLRLEKQVDFLGWVQLQNLPDVIHKATIAVISNRNTEFTSINFPTRIFEYAGMKTPMVLPKFPGIMDYVGLEEASFYSPENHFELADCIVDLLKNQTNRHKLSQNGYTCYMRSHWSKVKKHYIRIVEGVANEKKQVKLNQL